MKRFGTDEHVDDNGEEDLAADVEKEQVIMVWFGEQVKMWVNFVEWGKRWNRDLQDLCS